MSQKNLLEAIGAACLAAQVGSTWTTWAMGAKTLVCPAPLGAVRTLAVTTPGETKREGLPEMARLTKIPDSILGPYLQLLATKEVLGMETL